MRLQRYLSMSLAVGLLAFSFGSALAIVYYKHIERSLFHELQTLQKTQDALRVEWSQLLLEQGVWAQGTRVERVARQHLGMVLPSQKRIVVIDNRWVTLAEGTL